MGAAAGIALVFSSEFLTFFSSCVLNWLRKMLQKTFADFFFFWGGGGGEHCKKILSFAEWCWERVGNTLTNCPEISSKIPGRTLSNPDNFFGQSCEKLFMCFLVCYFWPQVTSLAAMVFSASRRVAILGGTVTVYVGGSFFTYSWSFFAYS